MFLSPDTGRFLQNSNKFFLLKGEQTFCIWLHHFLDVVLVRAGPGQSGPRESLERNVHRGSGRFGLSDRESPPRASESLESVTFFIEIRFSF